MSERKEWIGLTENMCYFIGKVVEDPYFYDNNGKENALVKIKTIQAERSGDQWVETPIIIPLYATQDNNVTTLRNHVKKGRQLKVSTYYKAWDSGHGFFIKSMQLGEKPFEKKDVPQGGGYNNLPPG